MLFLGLGMAVGSDGAGWLQFGDYAFAHGRGVALALILFDGGLSSGVARCGLCPGRSRSLWSRRRCAPDLGRHRGAPVHFDLRDGLLLGAVLASTDGAAIFALLRGTSLRRRLARRSRASGASTTPSPCCSCSG